MVAWPHRSSSPAKYGRSLGSFFASHRLKTCRNVSRGGRRRRRQRVFCFEKGGDLREVFQTWLIRNCSCLACVFHSRECRQEPLPVLKNLAISLTRRIQKKLPKCKCRQHCQGSESSVLVRQESLASQKLCPKVKSTVSSMIGLR